MHGHMFQMMMMMRDGNPLSFCGISYTVPMMEPLAFVKKDDLCQRIASVL